MARFDSKVGKFACSSIVITWIRGVLEWQPIRPTESIWMEDMKGMGMRGMHCGIPHMNVESNLTSGISGGEGRLSRKMVPVFCPMVCLLSCTNNSDHRNILIHAIVENCLTSSV